MTYIHRDIEDAVTSVSREYSVLILTGPRQTGKTTTLLKLAEDSGREYVSLDDLTNRRLAKSDPAMFLETHRAPLLVDEVQYAPELFSYIKMAVDKAPSPGAYWLTGSQSFRLMGLAHESLAGRAAVLQMSALSQKELYGSGPNEPFAVDLDKLLERAGNRQAADTREIYTRIFNGGMPALASGRFSDREFYYGNYLTTYIDRDVRDLSANIDALRFADFVRSAACRCSQLLNVADIAGDAFVDVRTARNWLGILEKSGVIFYLRPYSGNILKRTVKKPKLYFFDTGLVCYLTKWDGAATLENGAMNGSILENYVVSELMKTYHNSAREPLYYYFRDTNANEIDLVMESNGMVTPMEIKKTAAPGTELVRPFRLLDKGPLPRGTGAILCMYKKLSAVDKNNLIVPIWTI